MSGEAPKRLVAVALPVAVDRGFTYFVPEDWPSPPPAGSRVLVGFGHRVLVGIVRGIDRPDPRDAARAGEPEPLRPLLELLDAEDSPALAADLVQLCEWIHDYYLAPVGEVYRLALPGLLTNADARVVGLSELGARCLVDAPLFADDHAVDLDEVQLRILRALSGSSSMPLSRLAEVRPRLTGIYARIDELSARGLVECRWDDDATKTARTEPYVKRTARFRGALADEVALKRAIGRSKQRRALLDLLEQQLTDDAAHERAWVAMSELRASYPRARELLAPMIEVGLVETQERLRALDDFDAGEVPADVPREPTDDQRLALRTLQETLDAGVFSCALLQGITGSGKTEVYLQTIAHARSVGGGAIVLVPEIALTPQLAERFRARFGDEVAVLHSGLSARQRVDAWEHIRRGRRPIVIGARSAVFAPVPRLRVIVIDEEHDTSFKQEEGVRYHARDVALVRARALEALVVLGSATPSLESFENARRGRYRWLRLHTRPSHRPLPTVELLSMATHRVDPETMMSARLRDAVSTAIAAGEQVILFLNRRGYTTSITCRECGAFQQCPDCSTPSMTYHLRRNRLLCHLCGHIEAAPRHCLACGSSALEHGNAGTEKIEVAIRATLPQARIARLDRDTTRGKRLHETLARFRSGEVDILIGTQMLSKGHDFPGVTLVGVLKGDHGLAIPDLRSGERTFQLVTQVAGRAGRGETPGRVIVQAWSVAHPALRHAANHDFEGFASAELEARRALGNPPFGFLAMVHVQGQDEAAVQARATALGEMIRAGIARVEETRAAAGGGASLRMLGPVPSPIERINRRVRWQILVRASERAPLRWLLRSLRPSLGGRATGSSRTDARVDVDPQTLL